MCITEMKREDLISNVMSCPTHLCCNKHYQLSEYIIFIFIIISSPILNRQVAGSIPDDVIGIFQ